MNQDIDQFKFSVPRTKTLEIPLVDIGNMRKFMMPQDNELQGKTIIGIRVMDNVGGTRHTQLGRLVIPDAAMQNCFLTLKANSTAEHDAHPLDYYKPKHGDYIPVDIKGLILGNSDITFSDTTGVTSAMAVQIVFIYTD